MAKLPTVTLSVGSESFPITDPHVLEYAGKSGDRAGDSLRAALLCGVSAMDSAVVNKEVLALEARLSGVQNDVSSRINASAQELLSILTKATNPSVEGSLAGSIGKSLDTRAKEILDLLDPSNPKSPFAMLAAEMRGAASELLQSAVKSDAGKEASEKLAIKGRLYEDAVFQALIDAAAPYSDIVEATGDEIGLGTSKKGDFIIRCSGVRPLSIVVEAKRKKISLSRRFVETEIRAGMTNRGADAAILVVHPEFAASVGGPIKILSENIVACVFDPESPDYTSLLIAYQLTRASILREQSQAGGVDIAMMTRRMEQIAARVEEIGIGERSMTQLLDDLDRVRSQFGSTRRSLLRDIQDLNRELLGETNTPLVDFRAASPIQVEGASPRAALPPVQESTPDQTEPPEPPVSETPEF